MVSREQVRKLAKKFFRQRILVVGDVMLDRYIYGSAERISPEAPVPVVRVEKELEMPGGAANVARNVRELGGRAAIAGIVGEDWSGRMLMDVLNCQGIITDATLKLPRVKTTVKTRIVASRQQVVRIDWDQEFTFTEDRLRAFDKALGGIMKKGITGVVIEDYGKGVVTQEVVQCVLGAASKAGIPSGYDPKEGHDLDVTGVTVATPNYREACLAAGMPECLALSGPPLSSVLHKVGRALMKKWSPALLIITLGQYGMFLFPSKGRSSQIPTVAREVFDVSGAGDTVIAACVLALAAGADYEEAASIANYAAGVVVGKVGTAGCSVKELLGIMG